MTWTKRLMLVASALLLAAAFATALEGRPASLATAAPTHAKPDYLPWEVLSVSPSQRTLRIGYVVTSCEGAVPHVSESRSAIRIALTSPPASDEVCIEEVRIATMLVGLHRPVAGRRITGLMRRSLEVVIAATDVVNMPVPNVVGLRGLDARRALRATRLRATFAGPARNAVVSQRPRAGTFLRKSGVVALRMTR
jgi:hypothetical protein